MEEEPVTMSRSNSDRVFMCDDSTSLSVEPNDVIRLQ